MDTPSYNNDQQPTTAADPRTTVRTNWLRFSWGQISNASKVLLVISFTIALLQISATTAVLIYGSLNQLSCEKPLQLYLIVFVVRVGVSLPISIYQHLFTPRSQRHHDTRRISRRNRTRRTSNNIRSSSAEPATNNNNTSASTSTPVVHQEHTDNNTTETASNDTQQQQSASLLTGWSDKLKSLLDLFGILWFIVGNYLAFSTSSCPTNAAAYYYTILIWVLFGYVVLIVPLVACASVIFCLPCVLVAMRTFNINVSTVMVGGSKDEIANIPVFRYKAINDNDATSVDEEAAAVGQWPQKKPSYIRRFMHLNNSKKLSKQKDQAPQTKKLQTLTIPKQEDAVCTICLSEYETNELVCKLWCEHHYHKECVHEWLGLNSKCPLCKRDFRGKDYQNDQDSSSDDEEEQYEQ